MSATLLAQPETTAERLATAEELLEISGKDENRYELIKGVMNTMSPAGIQHGLIASRLNAQVQVFVEKNDLGFVFAVETGFLLASNPDTVRAPDVSFVSKVRVPTTGLPKNYFPGAPDLAVEVVSPGDRASEVQEKVQDWLTHGARLVWVVEPETRSVTVFRADGSAAVRRLGEMVDGEDVLPGFSYAVERLFA